MHRLNVSLAAFALTFSVAACQPVALAPTEEAESVYFLVRHAEKVDESEDPPLSEIGEQRALALADMLRDAGIEMVYSSDYKRTRDTAAPLIEGAGIEMQIYDPGVLDELAGELLASPGRFLVVGHSNTTPDLVRLLGGDPHSDITPDEYDRLYILDHRPSSGTTTTLLRFAPK